MIKIINNNVTKKDLTFLKVTCPECESVFEFQFDDLKLIENKINGKRLIDCPCCCSEFDTHGISIYNHDSQEDQESYKYSEITEEVFNGKTWYFSDGFMINRPEARKLSPGDAIVYYDESCPLERPVLIVDCFDYASDTAARALIGEEVLRVEDGAIRTLYTTNFTPNYQLYRYATEDEVKEFFKKYKENQSESIWTIDLYMTEERLHSLGIYAYDEILYEVSQN